MLRRALCCMICLMLAAAPALAEGAFTMAGYDGENSTHDWNTNGFFCPHAGKNGPDVYL